MVNKSIILRGIVTLLFAALLASCAVPTPAPYYPKPTQTEVPSTPTATGTPPIQTQAIINSGPTSSIPGADSAVPAVPAAVTSTSAPFLNLAPTLTARAALPSPTRLVLPTLAPEPTRTPVAPVSLYGPSWALIPSQQGLWAMRPNGSEARLLTTDPILRMSASPGGNMVAYISNPNPNADPGMQPYGYSLKVLTLSNGQSNTITPIDSSGITPDSTAEQLDNAYQTINAYQHGAMAWSPNGRLLAFVSGIDGPAANVYLYNPSGARVTRLTDLMAWAGPPPGSGADSPYGPHAYGLSWSPDGSRLYIAAAYSFGNSRTYWMAGAWLVDLNGNYSQVAAGDYEGEKLLAWVGSANVLLASTRSDCGELNLRTFTLSSQGSIPLWSGCYDDLSYDRYRQEALVSVTDPLATETGPAGLYLGQVTRGLKPIATHGYASILKGEGVTPWFGFSDGEGLFAIQRNGQVRALFTSPDYTEAGNRLRPAFRWPDTRTWLFTAEDGLYLARPEQPPALLFDQKPQGLWAAPGGARLFFTAYQDDALRMFSVTPNDLNPVVVNDQIADPSGIDWP